MGASSGTPTTYFEQILVVKWVGKKLQKVTQCCRHKDNQMEMILEDTWLGTVTKTMHVEGNQESVILSHYN